MVTELLVGVGVVVSLAYVLQPLVVDDPASLWDSDWWPADEQDGTETTTAEQRGRAIADGGQMCQNCGAPLDGDFTYCGECLTPVV